MDAITTFPGCAAAHSGGPVGNHRPWYAGKDDRMSVRFTPLARAAADAAA